MQPFPHHYAVRAVSDPTGAVPLAGAGLPALTTATPAEFGGPGDQWSPETLLAGAVASCFALTFRALASARRMEWTSLDCHVTGTLDRAERVTRFIEMQVVARLLVPAGADAEVAQRLLVRAEETCLVTRSLNATVHLDASVAFESGARRVEVIEASRRRGVRAGNVIGDG